MKIFIMNTVMPPGIDGSFVHKWEFVMNLLEQGHEVHVLTNEIFSDVKSNKICFHVEPKLKKQKFLNRISHRFVYVHFLIKLIRAHDFDILYTRTPSNLSGIIGYLSKKMMGIPLVFEINGIAFEEQKLMRNKLSMGTKNVITNALIVYRRHKEILMWSKADAIISVTIGIKRYLVQHGVDEDKIWVIGNGANTDLFKPMSQNIARNELGLDSINKYVCFVGNLAPWQGVEYLIQAAPLVLECIPKTKFLIVGDGVMREQLEKMVGKLDLNDDFIFTGMISYEDVPKYINASDVCVAPFISARNEKIGLSPLKLYEYLACGKPVVGSNIMGVGDLLEDSNAGIPFTPEDHIELANAINKILINNKLIEKFGVNARRTVVENHDWKKVTKKVENVCNSTIRLKRRFNNE